jgi:hypothetical protein
MPVAKTIDTGNLSDYKPISISILPVFSISNGNIHAEPDHCAHRKKWNDESTSIGLSLGERCINTRTAGLLESFR